MAGFMGRTRINRSQEAYQQKQYDKAAKLFENPDWKAQRNINQINKTG